jgi:hypothetical protein
MRLSTVVTIPLAVAVAFFARDALREQSRLVTKIDILAPEGTVGALTVGAR